MGLRMQPVIARFASLTTLLRFAHTSLIGIGKAIVRCSSTYQNDEPYDSDEEDDSDDDDDDDDDESNPYR